jgi:hypothetical protein
MAARIVRLLATLGIAGLVTWLGATGPAMAVPAAAASWVVTNPNPDGTYAVTDGGLVLRDTATGDVITCSAPDQTDGLLASGTYEPDQYWPDLTEIGWIWAQHDSCTDAQGAPATVAMAIDWPLYARSYDAGTGRTTGEAIPFHLISLVVDRPGCGYIVAPEYPFATADFTYTHSTSTLTMASRPQVIYDLQGDQCDELPVSENDPGSFSLTYTLTPAISIVGVE